MVYVVGILAVFFAAAAIMIYVTYRADLDDGDS